MLKNIILFIGFILATNIHANDNYYIGFGAGSSRFDSGIEPITADLDKYGTSYRLTLGKFYGRSKGFEFIYTDLGKSSFSGDPGDTFVIDYVVYSFTESGKMAVSAKTYSFSGFTSYDMSESVYIFGRLGVSHWKTTSDITATDVTTTIDDSGTGVNFGFGFNYFFSNDWFARGEHDLFFVDGEKVAVTSLNILYLF